MCWKTKNTPQLKVAEHDISVYKILLIRGCKLMSPIFMGQTWEFDTLYKTFLEKPKPTTEGFELTLGFHSLSDPPIIGKKIYVLVWVTSSGRKTVFRRSYNEMVYNCTIPKGSQYYENEYGEIISNKLIINKKHKL